LIPSPAPLDWSTPARLLSTTIASTLAGEALVAAGKAAMPHEIGHVNLELDCGDAGFPLTGQTGSGYTLSSLAADGAGVLLTEQSGSMNERSDSIGDNADTVKDIAARQASGLLTRMKLTVNQATCTRLKAFHDEYDAAQAYTHYGLQFRARRFEGSNCGMYGAAVIDVGGLLRRSLFTPAWTESLFIGSARLSSALQQAAYYPYGSATLARGAGGVDWFWASGSNIPASSAPILPGAAVMDAWTGPEDSPFAIAGAALSGPLVSAAPLTLYDPSRMASWAEQVWSDAEAQGSAVALGVTWTAGTFEAVHEVTYDAHCITPQALPFAQDSDDLFEDSD
jgi:hypothetical protein